MLIVLRATAFLAGFWIAMMTVYSAVRTFVLPRGARDGIALIVFRLMRRIFNLLLRRRHTYLERDRLLALYAPVSLIALLPAWLTLVLVGYMGMFWALDGGTLYSAFRLSGSSLLTLGSIMADGVLVAVVEFSEAAIGLLLVALLISYLPTLYSAFSRRESAVTLLEVRAGNPPSPLEMIIRYYRIQGLEKLGEMWRNWEVWFADIEESHTSLAALVFYRSPTPGHSWVTAAGTVLDAASLVLSAVDVPHDPQADLCIRAGYLALRKIADFFTVEYDPDPCPDDPTSVSRADFELAVAGLEAEGVPIKADREKAWRDFNGWRVNYDTVLLALVKLADAPESMWTRRR